MNDAKGVSMGQAFKNKKQEWTKVITRAREEDEFRSRLLQEPIPALREHGVVFPEGTNVAITAVEQADRPITLDSADVKKNDMKITICIGKAAREVSDEDLDKIAGGYPEVNPQITD